MEWKGIGYLQAFYLGGIYPSALNNKGAVETGFSDSDSSIFIEQASASI